MIKQTQNILSAAIVREDQIVTLAELCRGCALPAEQVMKMIEYGIIEPIEAGDGSLHGQFSAACLPRLQAAVRLQRDLELNFAGIAVALDLLDEVKSLRQLVNALQRD